MDVTRTEFFRDFPRYRREAHLQPIAVRNRDQIDGYFVSEEQFLRFKALQAREGVAIAVEDLDSVTIDALRTTRMERRHDHLNALLDD